VRGDTEALYHVLRVLFGVIGWHAQRRGGMALHSALCERGGKGLALAGSSGKGKSTACHRLPAPWVSLSDDAMLVLPDGDGRFWAHPYPTMSDFMNGGCGGSWDVQRALPLAALFFLAQSPADGVAALSEPETIGRLVDVSTQAAIPMERGADGNLRRELRLHRFDNVCSLARAVPGYDLFVSRHGSFWEKMELTLTSD
jgi:SynChlorMet cassette protein ScmC